MGAIFHLLKAVYHLGLWLLYTFHLYVEYFDMGLIGISSLFFFSQTANKALPDTISVAIGASVSIALVVLYRKIYKTTWGFWILRIASSVVWCYAALYLAENLFNVQHDNACLIAVAFGILSFASHADLDLKKQADEEWKAEQVAKERY